MFLPPNPWGVPAVAVHFALGFVCVFSTSQQRTLSVQSLAAEKKDCGVGGTTEQWVCIGTAPLRQATLALAVVGVCWSFSRCCSCLALAARREPAASGGCRRLSKSRELMARYTWLVRGRWKGSELPGIFWGKIKSFTRS